MMPLTQSKEVCNIIANFDHFDEDNVECDDLAPGCDVKDSLPHVKGGRHKVVGDLVVVGEDEIIEACAVQAYHPMYCSELAKMNENKSKFLHTTQINMN